MPKEYIKRLIELAAELREQLEAEQEPDFETVPDLLAHKINYICGYIDALKENKK